MINPNSELYQWGPIRGRILPLYYYSQAVFKEYPKTYQFFWPETYFIFHKNYITWVNSEAELKKSGRENFYRWMMNKKNRQKVEIAYKKAAKELFVWQIRFSLKYLDSLSDADFLQTFKKWQKLLIQFWVHGAVPEICNWGGEKLVADILTRKIGQSENFNAYYELLTVPAQLSFYQEEEIELLKILQYKRQPDLFQNKLKQHQQKYFWLLNNYYQSKILSLNFFKNKLKVIRDDNDKITSRINQRRLIIKNKTKLIKQLKLNVQERAIIESLDYGICWQDKRKALILQIDYYLDLLLKSIARRTIYSLNELKSFLPAEIIAVLNNKKISGIALARQYKYFIFYYDNKNLKFIVDQRAKVIAGRFIKSSEYIKQIKGLVVSQGDKVQGRVRIIKSFQQLKNFKAGEILVTPMTSPEYIVAMRQAKAIITDGGSMTCHAAIVSRELKVPCIVNAKTATFVLKNGDLVSVDTKEGSVTRLSK